MKATIKIFSVSFVFIFAWSVISYAQNQSVLDLGKIRHDVFINGKNNGEITVEELLNSKGIEAPDTGHYISGFGMNILDTVTDSLGRRGMLTSGYAVNEGNQFSKEMREAIAKLKPGSSIYISGIHCYQKYKPWHYVNTMYFKIK